MLLQTEVTTSTRLWWRPLANNIIQTWTTVERIDAIYLIIRIAEASLAEIESRDGTINACCFFYAPTGAI